MRSSIADALAAAMKDEQFDLVLTGLQSDDQGFAQIGVILAERLGLPHATIIMEVQVEGGALRVKRELEGGWFQWVAMPLPAVLTIQSGINQLRYATLKGIMAAKKKEIRKVGAAAPALGAQAEDRQPLRAGEGQEDADDRRLAGRSGEGAGAPAARRSAGDLHDSGHRRTARRQAQSRDLGNDRRGAAARRRHRCADRGRWCRAPSVGAVAAELAAAQVAGSRHRRARRRSSRTRRTASPRRCRTRSRSWRRRIVLLPHTYQTRDFAPKLAARLDRALITDVTGIKSVGGERRRSCGRCSRAS